MKAYFIPTTIALALGYTAGFATDGLSEVEALPLQNAQTVCSEVAAEQVSTVETFLANLLCEDVKSAFGLSVCPASAIRQNGVSIKWSEEGSVNMCTHIKHQGSWVPVE